MGQVIIQEETNTHPISTIGKMIGLCYGSDVSNQEKNYKRGINCIKAGHGRVLEFADAFFMLQNYSARVIREFYTHIGGAPTRVQESTRYINYSDFTYYVPTAIADNKEASKYYLAAMDSIQENFKELLQLGISKEDAANILPLGMHSGTSVHMNARTLENMANQRLCTRAYSEYRDLMHDLIEALSEYSYEWNTLCDMIMICKCDKYGYCAEEYSCGRYPAKEV